MSITEVGSLSSKFRFLIFQIHVNCWSSFQLFILLGTSKIVSVLFAEDLAADKQTFFILSCTVFCCVSECWCKKNSAQLVSYYSLGFVIRLRMNDSPWRISSLLRHFMDRFVFSNLTEIQVWHLHSSWDNILLIVTIVKNIEVNNSKQTFSRHLLWCEELKMFQLIFENFPMCLCFIQLKWGWNLICNNIWNWNNWKLRNKARNSSPLVLRVSFVILQYLE